MLKNLIKYEFKATGRTLGILYAALIIMSCVCRVMFGLTENHGISRAPLAGPLAGFSVAAVVFIYGLLICAVLVVTFLMIIQRFYKNLLQNEGYLMNMLPVKSWQHITAKLVAAVVWTLASTAVVILSILILSTLALSVQELTWDMFRMFFSELNQAFKVIGVKGAYIFIMTIITMLLSVAASVLHLYAAMAIGQTQNRYKIISSFAVYIGISIVFQLVSTLILYVSGYYISDGGMLSITNSMVGGLVSAGITVTAVYTFAKCAILFFTTNYFLKNKLNLE